MRRLSRLPLMAAIAGALVLLVATAAGAQVRRVETVGVLPLAPGSHPSKPPRDLAVRMALDEAVRRVARDLLRGADTGEDAGLLSQVLGNDPLDYTIRFRVVEDRGERPALFGSDSDAPNEYVVVVEAHIDASRIERRLQEAGLLAAAAGSGPEREVRLVVQDLQSFPAYDVLRRTLIEDVGAKSAVPVLMERGRAELVVRTRDNARQLLEDLLRAAPPELEITPLEGPEGVLTLRVALVALPEGADSEPPAGIRGPARDD